MPSDRTTVTELGTGLGMLGLGAVDDALRSRTPVMRSLSPEMWERLDGLRAGGAYDAEFHAAWANGQAFLTAADGLRGRLPQVVEWKGTGRAPGDEVAPIDLRVDHVYLVSCKYLSKILFNVSPASIFDSLLYGGPGRGSRAGREVLPGGGDWFADVAPGEYQALYESVRLAAGGAARLAPIALAEAPASTGGTGPLTYRRCVARPGRRRRRGPARRRWPTRSDGAAGRARAASPRRRPHSAPTRGAAAVARDGLAAGSQGALRRAVGRRGPGVDPPLGGGAGGAGRGG